MREVTIIRGRAYVTLETAARCYHVEVSWLHEVYEWGLLGRGERVGSTTVVPAATLERLGRILRMHRQQGLELSVIASLLEIREGRTRSSGPDRGIEPVP